MVAAITYRGRDVDPQSPDALKDVLAAIDYLGRLGYVDRRSIVVNGASGGGDLALSVAASTEIAAIVPEEPASSMFMGMFNKQTPKKGERYTAEDAFPLHADPGKFFTPEYRKLTREKVATMNCPILIVQGEETSRLNVFNRETLSIFHLYSVRGHGTSPAREVAMAAAYSMDLRTRVLRDSDAGLSSKELAERYHVSRAWVDALKQRRRETGAFAPLKPTKFRGRALAATDLDRLTTFIAARPDATLEEIREALRTSAGLTTIWRALNQLDFTLKKNGTRRRTTAPRRRR